MTFEEWYEENVKYMTTFDFKAWLQEAWNAGLLAEREACAKLVEEMIASVMIKPMPLRDISAAIRARGEK